MPLTPEQKEIVEQKLAELLEAQQRAYEMDCERLKLNKQEVGKDVNWDLYVAREKKWLTEYYKKEYRRTRVQLTRDFLDANKRRGLIN